MKKILILILLFIGCSDSSSPLASSEVIDCDHTDCDGALDNEFSNELDGGGNKKNCDWWEFWCDW